MVKRLRRSVLWVAVVSLLAGIVSPAVPAGHVYADPANTAGVSGNPGRHWAQETLDGWVENGLLRGFDDGSLRPDSLVSRAEFVALVNRLYGFTVQAEVRLTDVAPHQWYAGEVAKGLAAGFVKGYADGTFRPNQPITRQEAAVIVASLLGLEPNDEQLVRKFRDGDAIAEWSRNAVAAVVEHGYMNGYPDGTFRPAQPITRAEAIVTLDRTAARKLIKAGTYGDPEQVQTIEGNVVMTSAGVTLQNVRITGNLWVGESVGEGDVTLQGVTVEGKTFIRGGGANSIRLIDTELGAVIVNKKTGEVRIVAAGSTVIRQILLESGAILEEEETTGEGFGEVTITSDPESGAPVVTLNGDFSTVVVDAPNVTLQIQSGSVAELTVTENTANTTLNVSENAKVETLVLESDARVTGGGQVTHAVVHAPGATFEREPENLVVPEGVTVVVGGDERGSGEPPAPAVPDTPGGGNTSPGGGTPAPARPVIVSVDGVADVTVKYGTSLNDAVGKLAATTTITDSNGGKHTVRLSWTIADYNGEQAGEYEAVGTFTLPAAVASGSSVPLRVTAKVTVKEKPKIVSATPVSADVEVKYGTEESAVIAELGAKAPETTILDSDGGTHTVGLTWSIEGYKKEEPGEYTAKGTFALPASVAPNPDVPLYVTATVTVQEKPKIVSATPVSADVEVKYGTEESAVIAELGAKAPETTILDSDGGTHTVGLTWSIEGYKKEEPGEYTAKGTFALPASVAPNPDVPLYVTATVTVQEKPKIVSATPVSADVEVKYGTEESAVIAELGAKAPETTILDSDGGTHTVGLTWSIEGYKKEEPGEYTAKGTFALPASVAPNPDVPLYVTATVTVQEKPKIVSVTPVSADVEVEYGTVEEAVIAELEAKAPETTILDSDGGTHTVELIWSIEGYQKDEPGEYTAKGTFTLPAAVAPNPGVPLYVTATVTVKEGVLPESITSDPYAVGIKLRFDAPLAAPDGSAVSGFSVTVDGTPNQATDVLLDEEDSSVLLVILEERITDGMVTVTYTPSGLKTADDKPVGGFTEVIPTIGALVSNGKDAGKTLSALISELKAAGFGIAAIVESLLANGYGAEDVAAVLKNQGETALVIGLALRIAGVDNQDVYNMLVSMFSADAGQIASVFQPKLGGDNTIRRTASELVTTLAGLGVSDTRDLALALHVQNYTVNEAASALWNLYSANTAKRGEIGSSLTDAGYAPYDVIRAVLSIGGNPNWNSARTAWPELFYDAGGSLLTLQEIVTRWKAAGLTYQETDELLKIYETEVSSSSLAKAFFAAGYTVSEAIRALARFYPPASYNEELRQNYTTLNIKNAGYPAFDAALAMMEVWGLNTDRLHYLIKTYYGVANLDLLYLFRDLGYGPHELAYVVWLHSNKPAPIPTTLVNMINNLLALGLSIEEALVNLRDVTGFNLNTKEILLLVWQTENPGNPDKYAEILRDLFGKDAHETGTALLSMGWSWMDMKTVAGVLSNVYGVTPEEFMQIRNAYLQTQPYTPLYQDLSETIDALRHVFHLDNLAVARILANTARAADENNLKGVLQGFWEYVADVLPTWKDKVRFMSQAGYRLDEILRAAPLLLEERLNLIYEMGYSADEFAAYLYHHLNAHGSKATIEQMSHYLFEIGYASCTDLDAAIRILRTYYGSDNVELIKMLQTFGGCLIEEIGDVVDLTPVEAVQGLAANGAGLAQMIWLLDDQFNIWQPLAVADVLKQAGVTGTIYISHFLTTFKATLGLNIPDAMQILRTVYDKTSMEEIVWHLRYDGEYGILEILPHLGTDDPVEVMGYINAAYGGSGSLSDLVWAYGPRGTFNNPDALAVKLAELGVDGHTAVRIMQQYGFSPLKIAGLLASNGYDVGLAAMTMPNKGAAGWQLDYALMLKELTDCKNGELTGLPLCAGGKSTFGMDKVLRAIAASFKTTGLDCSTYEDRGLCFRLFETMLDAGFDHYYTVAWMHEEFHVPYELWGSIFYNVLRPRNIIHSARDVIDFFRHSWIEFVFGHEVEWEDIAKALLPWNADEVYGELTDATGGDGLYACTCMQQAGFSVWRVGGALMHHYLQVATRYRLHGSLIMCGFDSDEAWDVAVEYFPHVDLDKRYSSRGFPLNLIM